MVNIMEQQPKPATEMAPTPQKPTAASDPTVSQKTMKEIAPLQKSNKSGFLILGLAGAWVLTGLIAFIYSLFCFSKSGTMGQKVIGLLLSMLIGPFYFIYVYASSTYCK